jgi:NADH:ubiquinone oxidoreductase subunit 5 (subunit L)/multisubunit Na+/H+ antiporter MnhA subunit
MLFGICGNNLLMLLIGWEGIGFMSYLLISFYDNRIEASKSGLKAAIINKIGDIGLLTGILISYTLFATLKFNNINSLAYYFKFELLNIFHLEEEITFLSLISSFLLIGISAKSAQCIFNI